MKQVSEVAERDRSIRSEAEITERMRRGDGGAGSEKLIFQRIFGFFSVERKHFQVFLAQICEKFLIKKDC